jgi:hypothetical protein
MGNRVRGLMADPSPPTPVRVLSLDFSRGQATEPNDAQFADAPELGERGYDVVDDELWDGSSLLLGEGSRYARASAVVRSEARLAVWAELEWHRSRSGRCALGCRPTFSVQGLDEAVVDFSGVRGESALNRVLR